VSQRAYIQAISVGHALNFDLAVCGAVHSVFAHAVNLTVRGDMWTLLAEDKADLPFGIRLGLSSLQTLGLRRGDVVSVRAGFVGIGSAAQKGSELFCRNGPEGASHKRVPTPFSPPHLVVDCRTTARWLPACSEGLKPGLESRLAIVARMARKKSWHESAAMAQAVRSALSGATALGDVLAQVVGRGPGATPAGDDVLVGILAVLTSPHSGIAGARAAESIGRALHPLLPTTTDLSGHLLRQATKGLFGRDLQELVNALIGASAPQRVSEKVRRVVATGATSGADACAGLLAFAPSYFASGNERVSA
jgi:Protein of unknown function (DUF2877)